MSETNAKRPRLGRISAMEIVRICSERAHARQARDFAEADRLRDVLNKQGVKVFDRENKWLTLDQRSGPIFSKNEMGMSTVDIVQLIEERVEARSIKDYDTADSIRDKLRSNGVSLHDKEYIWEVSADGRRGTWGAPPHARLQRIPPPMPPLASPFPRQPPPHMPSLASPLAPQAPLQMPLPASPFPLQPPLRMRSPQLTSVLPPALRVESTQPLRPFRNERGGLELPTEVIECLVELRGQHRMTKNFTAADQIRDMLRTHGVRIDDNGGSWEAGIARAGTIPQSHSVSRVPQYQPQYQAVAAAVPPPPTYAPAPAAAPPLVMTKASIEEMLHQRELYRVNRDYAAADGLRDMLVARGVHIEDKQRRWSYRDLEGRIMRG